MGMAYTKLQALQVGRQVFHSHSWHIVALGVTSRLSCRGASRLRGKPCD